MNLKQTKAICDAATAGTERHGHDIVIDNRSHEHDGTEEGVIVGSVEQVAYFQVEADAIFWEHARTALPEMVEWVEKVQIVISEACRRFDNGEQCQMTHLFFHLESLLDAVGGPTKERPRKIMHVAALPGDENSGGVLYAVADDGSAWEMNRWRREWEKLPDLPPVKNEIAELPKEGE